MPRIRDLFRKPTFINNSFCNDCIYTPAFPGGGFHTAGGGGSTDLDLFDCPKTYFGIIFMKSYQEKNAKSRVCLTFLCIFHANAVCSELF